MRKVLNAAVFAAVAMSSSVVAAQDRTQFDATIVRTDFGIPHVKSDSWQGIGYGVAYAYAQDNLCLLAEEFVTVAGERSLQFGPEETSMLGRGSSDNLASDIFFRSVIDLPSLRAGASGQGRKAGLLATGYVAGYNRYLKDAGSEGIPEDCRGKAWVRPITMDDMLRLVEKQMLLASSLALAPAIAGAAPPGQEQTGAALNWSGDDEPQMGSNGWAFGGDVTADGRGFLIGNPHFPWFGPNRFWQVHATIPGQLDVMGGSLAGGPLPTLGFNRDIAWTHTVTAARHFTLYQLKLDPTDPTAYLIDGETVPMTARDIEVPMPDGDPPAVRTVYSTRYGPMVSAPQMGLGWSASTAFAIRDANSGNQRALNAWVRIAEAKNVEDVRAAVSETLGIPWVNTIAADRHGDALHADVTAVPNVAAERIADCATPFSALAAGRVTLLDGSRAECDWSVAPDTAIPGLMPAGDQAITLRRDTVTNSNDSYWLSNASAPHRELSPILGKYREPVSLRTRTNFQETAAALDSGPMDHALAKSLVYSNRSLAADMAVGPMLKLCETAAEAQAACSALAGWDRRVDLDSRGAYLFLTFWDKVRQKPDLWATAFDADDPVNTPRDLVTEGAKGAALLTALVEAATEVEAAGFALDAPWGDVQYAPRNDERIAIHGGPGTAGILNMQRSEPNESGVSPVHGSSYIQIVGFDDDGPVADAILSYSQSTNPASPHYGDQTHAYSNKEWVRLPFDADEIAAAQQGDTVRISE